MEKNIKKIKNDKIEEKIKLDINIIIDGRFISYKHFAIRDKIEDDNIF